MTKKRTVELRLVVTYEVGEGEDHVPDEAICHELLKNVANFAAGEGLLSGETDYVVDDWTAEVKTIGIQDEGYNTIVPLQGNGRIPSQKHIRWKGK